MKNRILFIFSFFYCVYAHSQAIKLNQSNWQQKVAYKINVSLDDKAQMLTAYEEFIYTNNSPDRLTEMYIHVWPNAYRDNHSAFAKQHLENGKTDVEYATIDQRGWIDYLSFKVNNQLVKVEATNEQDIVKIILNQALESGQSITVSTPFRVKIPYVFSRMGVENGMYCITQWYPKPAVYDANGWNPIPYLDQGEFYSEFGSFDVTINLPSDYVLAATGRMQDESEMNWLNELAKGNNPTNPVQGYKSIRFVQDSVHDFAWFCSKKFKVKNGETHLSNGQVVKTWLYAEKPTENGVNFINEAVNFYSEKVGAYPYSLAQVVITPLKAGGGMEYPTITNCAYIDRTVIVHEVGHNWFYGILGSNERRYPWMDESINTYYENRSNDAASEDSESDKFTKKYIGIKFNGSDMTRFLYQFSARRHNDQAGNLSSELYTSFNYGAIVYGKNPLSFRYLQAYLGDDVFDHMMHAYYEKWKFRHPLPNDFRNHAEQFTKQDLSWFFDDVLGSENYIDYVLGKQKPSGLYIYNLSSVKAPFPLSRMKGKNIIETHWVNGFEHKNLIDLSVFKHTQEGDHWAIDPALQTFDLYRHNNYLNDKGICKKGMPHFRLLPRAEQNEYAQWSITPVVGWNMYNSWMPGIYLANDVFPAQKFCFDALPLYSLKNKDLNGYLRLSWNAFNKSLQAKIENGLSWQKFDMGDYSDVNSTLSYQKLQAFSNWKFRSSHRRSFWKNEINARFAYITLANKTQSFITLNDDATNFNYSILSLEHVLKYTNLNNPFSFSPKYEFDALGKTKNFHRFSFEWNHTVKYGRSAKSHIQYRVYGGYMLGNDNTKPMMFAAGSANGFNDYAYDNALLGRSHTNSNGDGIFTHQVINKDAGFRNYAGVNNLFSKSWISAINLTIPIPVKMIPIGIYSDLSYFSDYDKGNTNSVYNAGVYLSLFKNQLAIYAPLAYSNKNDASFTSIISFTFHMEILNLVYWMRNFELD